MFLLPSLGPSPLTLSFFFPAVVCTSTPVPCLPQCTSFDLLCFYPMLLTPGFSDSNQTLFVFEYAVFGLYRFCSTIGGGVSPFPRFYHSGQPTNRDLVSADAPRDDSKAYIYLSLPPVRPYSNIISCRIRFGMFPRSPISPTGDTRSPCVSPAFDLRQIIPRPPTTPVAASAHTAHRTYVPRVS